MQIKPTIRYHFIPTLMSIIKVSDNDKCWKGCGEIGILIYCWWGYNMMQLLWKSLAVPQKIKHRITMWPSNSTAMDMPKIIKIMSIHSLCKNISPLFIIAKRGNISNVHQLMNGQTQWVIQIGVYDSACERAHAVSWVNLENISKWKKSGRSFSVNPTYLISSLGDSMEKKTDECSVASSWAEAIERGNSSVGLGFALGWWKCSGIRLWWWFFNIENVLGTTKLYTFKGKGFCGL